MGCKSSKNREQEQPQAQEPEATREVLFTGTGQHDVKVSAASPEAVGEVTREDGPAYATLSTSNPSTVAMFATPLPPQHPAPAVREIEEEVSENDEEEVVNAAELASAAPPEVVETSEDANAEVPAVTVEDETAPAAVEEVEESLPLEDLPPPPPALEETNAEAAVEEEEESEETTDTVEVVEIAEPEQERKKPVPLPKPKSLKTKPATAPKPTITTPTDTPREVTPDTPKKQPVPTPQRSSTPTNNDTTPSKSLTPNTTTTSSQHDNIPSRRSARSLSAMFERQLNPPAPIAKMSTKNKIAIFEPPLEGPKNEIVAPGTAKNIRKMFEEKEDPIVREGSTKSKKEYFERRLTFQAQVQAVCTCVYDDSTECFKRTRRADTTILHSLA